MRKLNKKPIFLAVIALIFVVTITIGSAMAYFTTFTMASGGKVMDLGYTKTEITDTVVDGVKHVTVKNTGDYDCFVRTKIFSEVNLTSVAGEGWTENADGYWYYDAVLPSGGETAELLIAFDFPKGTELEEAKEQFNIVVVHECTPAIYDSTDHVSVDWKNVVSVSE